MALGSLVWILATWSCISAMTNGPVPNSIKATFCKNAVQGYSMIPWDCSGYIHCDQTSGLASWVNCPHGLLFDMVSLTCEWQSSSCSRAALGEIAATWCPKRPDLVFAHPISCAMFYNCSKLQSHPEIDLLQYEDECISPALFDDSKKKCQLWPGLTVNRCGYIPPDECSYKRGCNRQSHATCNYLADGLYPAPDTIFSQKYINCTKGKLVDKHICNPPGSVFDPISGSCTTDFKYSISKYCQKNPFNKFPDPFHCAKYYDCTKRSHSVGLEHFQAECEYMDLFDTKSLSCVRYNNLTVPCGSRFEPKAPCEYEVKDCSKSNYCTPCSANCKGRPNGLVPYPGLENTRFHLLCENDRTVELKECPVPQVFLSSQRVCGHEGATTTTQYSETTTPYSETTTPYSETTTPYSETTTPYLETTTPYLETKTTPSSPTTTKSANETSEMTSSGHLARGAEQCACVDEMRPMNKTLAGLVENVTALYKRVDTMLPTPYDCTSPPVVANSVVKISYTGSMAIARYTCNHGYSVCGGELESVCKGDNTWRMDSFGKCVENTWKDMQAPSVISLHCPPVPGAAVSIRGRYIEERFTFALAVANKSYLTALVTPGSGVIQLQGEGTSPPELYSSPVPLTGELTWTVGIEESKFIVYVNGQEVASIANTVATNLLDKVNISSGFLSDQVQYHPSGHSTIATGHYPLAGNLAQGKRATVSSNYQSANPARASDGNTNTQWAGNSCWASDVGDPAPWWQTDLGMEYFISHLVLTSRDCSGACGERLHDFQIDVFKEDPVTQPEAEKETCYVYNGVFPARTYQTIKCDSPVTGRYVRVRGVKARNSTDLLTLCEVEVYGGVIQPVGGRLPVQTLLSYQGHLYSCLIQKRKQWPNIHATGVTSCVPEVMSFPVPAKLVGIKSLVDVLKQSKIKIWETVDKTLLVQNLADVFLQLELVEDNNSLSVNLSQNISQTPSRVLSPSTNLFMVNKESHIVVSLLTDHLLIQVDDKTLYKYPMDTTTPYKSNLIISTPGLEIRKVKIHNERKHDILREPVTRNLALKSAAIASSSDSKPPTSAVDGNTSSCWRAQSTDSDQWYQVDLAKHYFIRDIKLDVTVFCPGCETRLHDFSVYIYVENPANDKDAVGKLCTRHSGDFPMSGEKILHCIEVWGRYVRIKADRLLGEGDRLTICEMEVYADKAVKKEWSPFECPSPPLHPNSRVTVTYSEKEAHATYDCVDNFSTCNGLNTITCDKPSGWRDDAEECVRTVFTADDRLGITSVNLPCPLQLGQAIEMFVTQKDTQSEIRFMNALSQSTVLEMSVNFSAPYNALELHTYPLTPAPSRVTVPDMAFTRGEESRVTITFLSDHTDVSVDGKSIYAYPNHLPPHLIDSVSSTAHVRKLSVLQANEVQTKLSPVSDNIALARPTSSSSDVNSSVSGGRVVDGVSDPTWSAKSCWSTKVGDLDPWWQVQLDSFYSISHVHVVARGDCSGACGDRLHDFVIEVFHKDPEPGDEGQVCRKYQGVFPPGTSQTLKCSRPVTGQYVRISSPGRSDPSDILTLCEVEVYGGKILMEDSGPFDCKTPPRRPNSIVEVTTTSTSLVAKYTCEEGFALCGEITPSYCVNGIWGDFKARCFQNVWHYTTMGDSYKHEISCPLSLNSHIRVIATPTTNTGFTVDIESAPEKKILLVEASFADTDYRTVKLMIKDGTDVITTKTKNSFPFEIGKEFELVANVLKDKIELIIDGVKFDSVPIKLPMYGSPSVTTSNLATREVQYYQTNKAVDIVHYTDANTPWLNVPVEGVTHKLFEVKACEEVLVELRESETSENGVIFTLGGRKNTMSECTSCSPDKLTTWHRPVLCHSYMDFWVSWGTPGKVSIGEGHTVGVTPFIQDVPAEFEKNFLRFGTNGTEGHWIFPESVGRPGDQEKCPKPQSIFPLEVAHHSIADQVVTTDYICDDNYVFCGESSSSVCDNGAQTSQVKGACELSRIPVGTGPVTSLDLPCLMGEGSSISAYITPTNPAGKVLMELSGSSGKSLQLHIDMKTSTFSLTSVLENDTMTQAQTVTGFPFTLDQESHVVIKYTSGKYTIYVNGKLVSSYTLQVPHDKMSKVSIHSHYTVRDLQAFPFNAAGAVTSCETATVANSVITGTNRQMGGEATLQCAENYRYCSSSNTITCGGDGEWIVPPDQTCKQYKWTNEPRLRIPTMKKPPCPLASGMAIKLVASAAHSFWFDLRSGREAQMLLQYETRPTVILRMTTAILNNVLFEKIIDNPPISLNKKFTLVVELHDNMYSIVVDGKLLYDYAYLTPVNRTEYLIVTTGVTITDLEFMDTIPPRSKR